MNLMKYLQDLSGDPDYLKKKAAEADKDKKRFYIGGQSGFKWRTESANKTWVENGRIIKENKGKKLSNK